jgi:DNA-binding NtrC family response regulator
MGSQTEAMAVAGREVEADAKVSPRGALDVALRRREREVAEKALTQAHGNVAEAAARMGILRTSLYRIMKRYGIAVPNRARD